MKKIWKREEPLGPSRSLKLYLRWAIRLAVSILAVIILALLGFMQVRKIEVITKRQADGKPASYQLYTIAGYPYSEAQLDSSGNFDGPIVGWELFSHNQKFSGNYRAGYFDGDQKHFNPSTGEITRVERFEMGKLTALFSVRDGALIEVPRGEWPWGMGLVQKYGQRGPAGLPAGLREQFVGSRK